MDMIDFFSYLTEVHSLHQLRDFLKDFEKCINATHSIYVFLPIRNQAYMDNFFTIDNYPDGYLDEYIAKNLILVDPVVIHADCARTAPTYWHESFDENIITEQENLGLEWASHNYGIEYGILSTYSSKFDKSILHFALDKKSKYDVINLEHTRKTLQVFANLIHYKTQQLIYDRVFTDTKTLSPREIESLLWAARGKTVSETATILRISKSTIAEYISLAMKKLDANTKTEAVAKAITNGNISPFQIVAGYNVKNCGNQIGVNLNHVLQSED